MVNSSLTFTEGEVSTVCAELQALPPGGTECEISVAITTVNMTAGLMHGLYIDIAAYSNWAILCLH